MMKITKRVLESLFDEYNKLYFENELIKPLFNTYIGETTMGIFNVSKRQNQVRTKIMIARNVRFTQEDLKNVLVHEMIHLYVYQKYGPGHGHKKPFIDKMNELNEKYGLDVRKNSRHLRRKMIKRKKNDMGLTGRIQRLRTYMPSILRTIRIATK